MTSKILLFHEFQLAHAALFRAANRHTRAQHGLTATQLGVLFVLSRQDGLPISRIARQLAMSKSSLSTLIDRMEETGLIKSIPSTEDARVTNIYLAPEGHKTLKEAGRDVARINSALLEPFSGNEIKIIRKFLTHLTKNTDEIINAANTQQPVEKSPQSSK